jgi:hypothetical protein
MLKLFKHPELCLRFYFCRPQIIFNESEARKTIFILRDQKEKKDALGI